MISKADEIKIAMQGNISKEQNSKMTVCLNHYDYINCCISQLDTAISLVSSEFGAQIELISTVPGLTNKSATTVISEIGTDMSVFKDAKHLCSWAGVTPQNNESAGKKKNVHISRAGTYLKPILIQCANAAIKDKSCPYFKYSYESIKKRRGYKRAIIAIARMLLTCIYNMFLVNPLHLYKYYTINNSCVTRYQVYELIFTCNLNNLFFTILFKIFVNLHTNVLSNFL